jgi:DUF917 family protein
MLIPINNTFTLKIELGNFAMRHRRHVAKALEDVARRLREHATDEGRIRDVNGNTVGDFAMAGDSDPADYETDTEVTS